MFRFQSEEAKKNIFKLSHLLFGNGVLFLWPWKPINPIQRLNLDMVPVWIEFPNLHLHYLNSHFLSGLGSLIGKPLFIDKLTTYQSRVIFARICVEIKAREPLPESVEFIDEEGVKHTQDVIYEWMPQQCPKCKRFGHNCTAPTQPKRIFRNIGI